MEPVHHGLAMFFWGLLCLVALAVALGAIP